MTAAPLAMYEAALRAAAIGRTVDLAAVGGPERARPLDATGWCGASRPGDGALLARCTGATLDVGCGPGRLLAQLIDRAAGRGSLGIDVSATAVRLARRRGGDALLRDVFRPVPAEGSWDSVVLADGNVGIGGDPVALLDRCRAVVHGAGRVVVEVEPPGRPSWSGSLRLRTGDRHSAPFHWAYVGVDDIATVADAAALRTLDIFAEAGRWFATLSPA
jgi:SAM-dependent methyltransferase